MLFAMILTIGCASSGGPPLGDGWFRYEADDGSPYCHRWDKGDGETVMWMARDRGWTFGPSEVEVVVHEDGSFSSNSLEWEWSPDGEVLINVGYEYAPGDCPEGEVWWE